MSLLFAVVASADDKKPEEGSVDIEVEVKELGAQPVVQIRFTAKRDEIGAKLGPAYGTLMAHLNKHGAQPVMMPLARYFSVAEDMLAMAAAMAVAKPLASEGDIEADELPAGTAAATWHIGPYEGLAETNAKLEQWITESGHEAKPESWEVYVTDPGSEPDPQKWRTQIFRPLKK